MDHVLGSDSIVWQRSGDVRLMLAAGYALLLQLGHPTVAAGVRDHSDYRRDPWRRMQRSSDYATVMIYGGPLAIEAGRKLRERHKAISGALADGRKYHALEPRAFAWVHATLGESILRANEHFVGKLEEDEEERFYLEFRKLGRVHGVREGDLPDTLAGFRAYFADMVENELQDSEAVQDFIAFEPDRAPIPGVPLALFRPLLSVSRLTGRGMLPETLRKKFSIAWTAHEQERFARLSAAMRRLTPLLPATLRNTGPAYMRLRPRLRRR
jgi:uncharacterized protein (DUF2236 family)